MVTKVELIDTYIDENFKIAYDSVKKIYQDNISGLYLALALKDIIKLDDEGQRAVENLKGLMPLFLRFVHAKVLAALFSKTLVVDSYFGILFDEKTRSLKLDNLTTEYLIALMDYYIEVVDSQEKSEVPDEYIHFVLKLWPLYKISSLNR